MGRIKKDFTFGITPTKLLTDINISLKAKGLYGFMNDKPDDWNFTIRSMSKQLLEGEDAIKSALQELKDSGWISYQRLSTGGGEYTIHHTIV